MKCTVLPLKNLYFPVLPTKSFKNDKLLFPLCRTCAEEEQTSSCTHSEKECVLEGVWVSPEPNKTLELGYKLIKVSEVWNFTRKKQNRKVSFQSISIPSSKLNWNVQGGLRV